MLTTNFAKHAKKETRTMKEFVRAPMLKQFEAERVIFQRNLGRLEIPGSNNWTQSTSSKCNVCNKLCYCIFVWNLQV